MGNMFHKNNISSVTQDVVNQIVAQSMLQVESDCIQTSFVSQALVFNCNSEVNGTFYEENTTCTRCYENITNAWNSQMQEEEELWSGSGVSIRTGFDRQFQDIMTSQENCQLFCKACMFSNNSQQSTIQASASCTFDADITSDLQNQITANLMNSLYSHTDILHSFANVMGAKSDTETQSFLSNTVTNTFSVSILQEMVEQIQVHQTMSFSDFAGSSASVTGNSQESAINAMVTFLANNKIANNMMTQSQWDSFSEIYNESTTIDKLGNTVFGLVTSVVGTLDSTIGKILIGSIIILALVLVAVIVLIIIKKNKG
jgi:hypothetical protein